MPPRDTDSSAPLLGTRRAQGWRRHLRPAVAVGAAAAAATALLLLLLRPSPPTLRDTPVSKKPIVQGDPPFCRKSSSIAVLPGEDNNLQLLAWAGIGLHKSMFDDLHRLDMGRLVWTAEDVGGERPWGGRWKAGNAQVVAGGMVVFGGDAYLPGTRRHCYENDVWRLSFPALKWQRAEVPEGSELPARRRGHSTMHYTDAAGIDHIVIFGGRTKGKEPLNDAWDVKLRWPNASWRCITPQQPAGKAAPEPRRGHSAVLVSDPGAAEPQMLVYGGRAEEQYFDDMWLLSVATGEWRRVEPAGRTPSGRDHHAAVFFNGSMFVFAGRSGENYSHSHPLNSLWRFDLAARAWTEIQQTGDARGKPLPRFEHAYAQVSRPGSNDSALVVFGGQTTVGVTRRQRRVPCQMNDVWSLSLSSLIWREVTPPRWCNKKCEREHRHDGDG